MAHRLVLLIAGLLACDSPSPQGPAPRAAPQAGSAAPHQAPPRAAPAEGGATQRAATPTERCERVTLEPGPAPSPPARASWGFTMPPRAELLRIEARWNGPSKRALSLGPGSCPPCEQVERRKGRQQIALELLPGALGLSDASFPPGEAWYLELEGDPDGDDWIRDRGTVSLEACTLDPGARAPGAHGLLPPEGLVPASLVTIERDAFGFARLVGVHTARYRLAGRELTAFLIPVQDPAEARALAEAYREDLVALGGTASPPQEGEPVVVELWGAHTTILATPEALVGVQEADDEQAARQLTARLGDWLARSH